MRRADATQSGTTIQVMGTGGSNPLAPTNQSAVRATLTVLEQAEVLSEHWASAV